MPSFGSARRSYVVAASNFWLTSNVPPMSSGVRAVPKRPAVWNSGMSHRKTDLYVAFVPSARFSEPENAFICVMITPFGLPVVPEL